MSALKEQQLRQNLEEDLAYGGLGFTFWGTWLQVFVFISWGFWVWDAEGVGSRVWGVGVPRTTKFCRLGALFGE